MDSVYLIFVMVALGYLFWCLLKVVFAKGQRRMALKRAGVTFGAIIGATVFFGLVFGEGQREKNAKAKGFASYAEMQRAEEAAKEKAAVEARAKAEAEMAVKAKEEAKARAEAEVKAKMEAEAKAKIEAEAAAKAEEEAKAKAVACREEAECWYTKIEYAAKSLCKEGVERQAKYDYEWTDTWKAPAFTRVGWANKKKGTFNIAGDEVKYQNGFGAWMRMKYICTIDPEEGLIDIAVQEGRL